MTIWLPALSAFVLTVLGLLLALKFFPKWGLLDRPAKYGLTRAPIPYPAGVILYLVFVILVAVFYSHPDAKMIALLFGGGLITGISFLDDRFDLPPWLRLLVQVAAALALVAGGIGVRSITNPLGGFIPLDAPHWTLHWGGIGFEFMLFSALFTVAWVLLLTNTMNWLDGIPGLVSGISTIGGLVLFFLSLSPIVRQPEVATLALVVAAMAFAFWLFDFYPPRVLIGDSGSMFFGFMLAVLAIFSGGKIATAVLILGFPILDAAYVILYRISRKQAPWKGGEWDRQRKAVHLHHRLLRFGFSERQALSLIYFACASFGVIALLVGTRGKFWAFFIALALSFVLGWFLRGHKD